MIRWLKKTWISLTYWEVPCDGCNGTGICAGVNSDKPHSCCGDCDRITVAASNVPPDFAGIYNARATIGTGIMWRRPWSKRQVNKPDAPYWSEAAR